MKLFGRGTVGVPDDLHEKTRFSLPKETTQHFQPLNDPQSQRQWYVVVYHLFSCHIDTYFQSVFALNDRHMMNDDRKKIGPPPDKRITPIIPLPPIKPLPQLPITNKKEAQGIRKIDAKTTSKFNHEAMMQNQIYQPLAKATTLVVSDRGSHTVHGRNNGIFGPNGNYRSIHHGAALSGPQYGLPNYDINNPHDHAMSHQMYQPNWNGNGNSNRQSNPQMIAPVHSHTNPAEPIDLHGAVVDNKGAQQTDTKQSGRKFTFVARKRYENMMNSYFDDYGYGEEGL